ncbi:hypothetical protein T439DRAFT_326460 [Meredithblackwellia eburnea MCA 4105]
MASTTTTRTLLLLGSTGETGSQALLSALKNPAIAKVHALGRTPPSVPHDTPGFDKLVTTPTISFDGLLADDQQEKLKLKDVDADLVVITLGTTRAKAGSFKAFEKIDKDYVLAAAEAARIDSKHQVLTYCSSGGSSSGSPFPYLKSKGLTEEGLAGIGYSETLIFRPGMLQVPGGRKESRLVENIAGKIVSLAAHFAPSLEISTPVLGAALVRASVLGTKGIQEKFGNEFGKKEDLKGAEAFTFGNTDGLNLGKDPQQA